MHTKAVNGRAAHHRDTSSNTYSVPEGRERPLHTPDGRYVVVRGQLWRASNPELGEEERRQWTQVLMSARRSLRRAGAGASDIRSVRARVDEAKRALGERGPPWWHDGAPDYGRCDIGNTPYAAWYAEQQLHEDDTDAGYDRHG